MDGRPPAPAAPAATSDQEHDRRTRARAARRPSVASVHGATHLPRTASA